MLHIIVEGILDVLMRVAQALLAELVAERIDLEARLAVVRRKETAVLVVDALLHADDLRKRRLLLLIGEVEEVRLVAAEAGRRTDEEDIGGRVLRLSVCGIGKEGPIFRAAVIHRLARWFVKPSLDSICNRFGGIERM